MEITTSQNTLIATGTAREFPRLAESSACQRWIDLKVKGRAGRVAAALEAVEREGAVQ